MINERDVELAYIGTTESRRVSLSEGLKDYKGERANVVYSVLQELMRLGFPFGSLLQHADGGVQYFAVTYSFGEYVLIVQTFGHRQTTDWPFDDIATLCAWLNKQERKILATAALLSA